MGRTSDYGKSVSRQLEEVMARLESAEKESRKTIADLNLRIDGLEKENKRLKQETEKMAVMQEQISSLQKENETLKHENKLLRDDNARLRSIINNNSSNTSTPPSRDRKGSRPVNSYNGRKKTTRSCGGQGGHKGVTLTREEAEEKIKSGRYQTRIQDIGEPDEEEYITKYVLDIEVVPTITEVRIHKNADGRYKIPEEYRSEVTYGVNVKAAAAVLYSEGVMSNDRIAAFLNAISNESLGISEGSIYQFCSKLCERCKACVKDLGNELLNQQVVSTDATPVTVNGKQAYIRNTSTAETVVYHAMESKSVECIKSIPFFASYAGILVHDHETGLYHFGTGHAECNVHIIRYLRKDEEETQNKWARKMIELLCEMNNSRKELIGRKGTEFGKETIAGYKKKYTEILEMGREENKKTKHKYAQQDEKSLLNRMEKYKDNHLLFLENFSVPFDNNMSERDLRKAKNRQKMA